MMRMLQYFRKLRCLIAVAAAGLVLGVSGNGRGENVQDFDAQVQAWALECRRIITDELEGLLASGVLNEMQLFDTFYIPIPGTNPQKFHTQYDQIFDQKFIAVLDKYLDKDARLAYVVAVDRNGYLPAHNSRYAKPLTQNPEYDLKNNRTKRMFNDRTGLAAARNIEPFLQQRYARDTGEEMIDLSVPIFIKGRHWGAVRFGYLTR